VVGRIKDVLTMRGRTLHAHDIEAHAERGSSHLRPGCCAAFSVQPQHEDGEVLILLAELRPEAPLGDEDLLAVVRVDQRHQKG